MDTFEKRPAGQINSWEEMMVQLVRIVAEHNDLDPSKVH